MKRTFLILFILILLLALYSKGLMYSERLLEGKFSKKNYEIVATNLKIPWDIAFLPDGALLVTERPGNLVYLGNEKKKIRIETSHIGEGGLLGLTLHPDFQKNHWIYLYNTYDQSGKTFNRIERYRYENGVITDQKIIIRDIPGSKYHDGGRMAFGPDGYLYITTGDAEQENLAQDLKSLAGKILRIKDDGSLPLDNPFGNAIYSYGHRNPQGLTWDDKGRLWSTEHGPSGVLVNGQDELNLIEKGQNYGWPVIMGDETASGMKSPVLQSGSDTWAPASALYWDGSIFFGGLRGAALYEAKVNQDSVELEEHFKGIFGRIRTVVIGPDGYFYLTTSNDDGRGEPKVGDDKIIKLDPRIFR